MVVNLMHWLISTVRRRMLISARYCVANTALFAVAILSNRAGWLSKDRFSYDGLVWIKYAKVIEFVHGILSETI